MAPAGGIDGRTGERASDSCHQRGAVARDENDDRYRGIAGDGVAGFMDFTMTDGNNFVITNYSQDTYQGTPVGNKSIGVTSNATMSGFISDTGVPRGYSAACGRY